MFAFCAKLVCYFIVYITILFNFTLLGFTFSFTSFFAGMIYCFVTLVISSIIDEIVNR